MSPDAGLPAAAGVTYGIDIGGTKVLGVALGDTDDVVAEARVPTPTGNREVVGSHVAEAVAQVVVELDAALHGAPGATGAPPVGVGAPGMVDRARPALLRAQPAPGPGGGLDRARRGPPARAARPH